MGKREPIKTTIREAADYWAQNVDECDLSVDWSEGTTHCWRCGCEKRLQRCHIIPHSLGGKDEPANIVLLCKRCHADGPNVSDPEIMWDWIKAYRVPFYNTFWAIQGMKEYEFIYKKTFEEEIQYILDHAGSSEIEITREEIDEEIRNFMRNEMSTHFGQPYFNTSTIAGLYRMLIKKLSRDYGVEIQSRGQQNEIM